MRRKKKPLTDIPDEKVIEKLFPKKVVKKAKEVAHEKDEKPKQKRKKQG